MFHEKQGMFHVTEDTKIVNIMRTMAVIEVASRRLSAYASNLPGQVNPEIMKALSDEIAEQIKVLIGQYAEAEKDAA